MYFKGSREHAFAHLETWETTVTEFVVIFCHSDLAVSSNRKNASTALICWTWPFIFGETSATCDELTF